MSSVHHSGKRVIIAVIELVSLSSHSGVSHDDIAVIMQTQMYIVSGVRTLVNRHLTIVIECVAGSIGSALLAFLRECMKQLFTLLRIESVIVVYQAENCAHINRPPHW